MKPARVTHPVRRRERPRRPVQERRPNGHPRPAARPARRRGRIRKALGFLALDPRHAVRDLSLGFALGGLAVGINVGVYALAGWYQVQSVQLDIGPFLIGGLGGYL